MCSKLKNEQKTVALWKETPDKTVAVLTNVIKKSGIQFNLLKSGFLRCKILLVRSCSREEVPCIACYNAKDKDSI